MAIICRDLSLLFVLTPHTASSAVGKVLREELGGEWVPEQHIQNRRGKTVVRRKHCTARDLVRHDVLSKEELETLHVFTTVRNPFDRLVTAYHKRRNDWAGIADDPESWIHRDRTSSADDLRFAAEHPFDEWLAQRYGGSPLRKAATVTGMYSMFRRFTRDADTVMRFEQVQADFDAVMATVGHGPVEIPSFNPTKTRPTDYREYYDDASRRLVERSARWDLRTFDYEF
jgi:hypothetical protein